MKKPILSLTLAATLAIGAVSVQAAVKQEPAAKAAQHFHDPFEKKILKAISAENIYENIDYLSKVPRVAGTESEAKAVQFIKEEFESYGYKADVQPFTFYGYTPPSSISLSVDGYEGEWKPQAFTYSVSGNVSGELVLAGLGKKDELSSLDLSGKIALIERGEISFAEKVLNAAEKGAAGVIIYNNAEGALSGTLGEHNDKFVPSAALSKAEGEALLSQIGKTVSLSIVGAETGEKTSHNVIAVKKTTGKKSAANDIIVLGAHHDSVAGAPGANDDASGTAMTLELARVLKNVPADTEIRFVTFGAEEVGLLGSEHYVSTLSDDEISRTVANFNLDMVGSRDAGDLVMLTLDGKPNLVTDLAQKSSEKLNGEPTPYGQGGRSDHVPFAEARIPAALFIHSPSEPWYHTPEDSIDKISKEKLQDTAEIVGTAIYDRARMDQIGPKPKKAPKFKAPDELKTEENIK
ncbi:M28 family peptidase [Metabacillus indicus]|uniref:Aminopeptidase n=1 Tax=Metabacillus indicus TaxID=246786 RepID=A0A084H1T3_METID|nr:M28 family peptidase [Metabacillus indicus]KEZ53545.1 aminopeptidase [Metabacillus indicus]